MMNSYQLILSLLMLNINFPGVLKDTLTNFDFCLFNFEIIPFPSFTIENKYLDKLDSPQEIDIYSELGYESKSFFVNNYVLVKSCVIFIILHVALIPFFLAKKYLSKYRLYQALNVKLFNFFHFAAYIRILFESEFMLIVLGAEALRNSPDIFSKILAAAVGVFLFALILINPIYRKNYQKKTDQIESSVWSELFTGMKTEKFI